MFVMRHSISLDGKYVKVKSPFLTAINSFKFDGKTCCSLVKYTFGVILLLSLSIPNVFLKNAILCRVFSPIRERADNLSLMKKTLFLHSFYEITK